MRSDALADMVDQAFAGIFDQVKNMFEAIVSSVVRIRHDSSVVTTAELGQPSQFFSMLFRAALLGQRQIVPVHRQQQIMTREIITHDLPCSEVGQFIAAALCVALAAIVRRFTRVVIMGAGRIDAHLAFQPVLPDEMVKYAMCCRAAADVPHAEEQNAERG